MEYMVKLVSVRVWASSALIKLASMSKFSSPDMPVSVLRKALILPRRLDFEATLRRRAGCSASFGSSDHAFVGNPQSISAAASPRPAPRP